MHHHSLQGSPPRHPSRPVASWVTFASQSKTAVDGSRLCISIKETKRELRDKFLVPRVSIISRMTRSKGVQMGGQKASVFGGTVIVGLNLAVAAVATGSCVTA